MKKLFVLLLALIFATMVSVPVLAENDFDLVCTHTVSEDGKVLVKASVRDIVDETGIVLLEYHIMYDETLLRLDVFDVNIPSSWEPFLESEMAEDNSTPIQNGLIWWVLNVEVGYGVKEDDELAIELEFTLLTDSPADIEFKYKSVGNDYLEYMYGPNRTIHVEPVVKEEPAVSSSVETTEPNEIESSEDVSVDVESGDIESSEVDSTEHESDVEVSSDVESSVIESSEDASDEIAHPDEPAEGTEPDNSDEGLTDAPAEDSLSSDGEVESSGATESGNSSSSASDASDVSASDNNDNGNSGFILIIIAAVVIVGGIAVVLLKKGKK